MRIYVIKILSKVVSFNEIITTQPYLDHSGAYQIEPIN